MAAHLHLVVRDEEAKLVVAAVSAGEHKGALMAMLCCDQAHRFAIERAGVDDDGCRVASLRSIAEHFDQKYIFGVAAIGENLGCHGWSLPISAVCRAAERVTSRYPTGHPGTGMRVPAVPRYARVMHASIA